MHIIILRRPNLIPRYNSDNDLLELILSDVLHKLRRNVSVQLRRLQYVPTLIAPVLIEHAVVNQRVEVEAVVVVHDELAPERKSVHDVHIFAVHFFAVRRNLHKELLRELNEALPLTRHGIF
jgi:hypothetical protein